MTFLQKSATVLFWLFFFLLPTQLGKHFFMPFSYVNGVRVDYLALVIHLTDILFVLLVGLYWKHIWNEMRRHRRILFPIGILATLNCAFSQHPLLASYSLLKLIEIYIAFVLFKTVHVPQRIVLSALTAGTLVQLFLALGQFKVHQAIQGLFYYLGERALSISTPGVAKASLFGEQILRPYGTFSHPNSLGGFYVLLFAWILSITTSTSRGVIAKISILIMSAMLVLISFSKAAIVTLGVVIVAYFYQRRTSIKACKLCLIARSCMILLVGAFFLSAHGDVFSFEKRAMLIKQSFQIISKSPLWGTHFGHYLYAHADFATPYPYFFLQPVHNIFILFIMQSGVVLGGLVGWGLISGLKKSWHRHKKLLLLPLFVIILTGSIDHYWITLQQNMLLMGIVFGSIMQSSLAYSKHTLHKSGGR